MIWLITFIIGICVGLAMNADSHYRALYIPNEGAQFSKPVSCEGRQACSDACHVAFPDACMSFRLGAKVHCSPLNPSDKSMHVLLCNDDSMGL